MFTSVNITIIRIVFTIIVTYNIYFIVVGIIVKFTKVTIVYNLSTATNLVNQFYATYNRKKKSEYSKLDI